MDNKIDRYDKELTIRFGLGLFKINVYSENRVTFQQAVFMYKHFVQIWFIGIRILSITWRTGVDMYGNINKNDFKVYKNGKLWKR